MNIDFDYYQHKASKTAIYPGRYAILYPALGLANEAGEVAGKIKKVLRDNDGDFTPEYVEKIKSEMGDVLWYFAALASDLGLYMGDIATDNLDKLSGRAERGTLGGDGDSR